MAQTVQIVSLTGVSQPRCSACPSFNNDEDLFGYLPHSPNWFKAWAVKGCSALISLEPPRKRKKFSLRFLRRAPGKARVKKQVFNLCAQESETAKTSQDLDLANLVT